MIKHKVAIDIGHGGIDGGTHGGGMKEKKVNWNEGMELNRLLIASGNYTTFVTRPNDEFITLNKRSALINAFNPEIAIAIHHNAGGGHGYDIIYNHDKPLSLKIAFLLKKEYDLSGQIKHGVFDRVNLRGQDYYGIQRNTKAPLIISEYAFMDTDDVKKIDTLDKQKAIAMMQFKAINKFFGL